jgi:hypothetical protein
MKSLLGIPDGSLGREIAMIFRSGTRVARGLTVNLVF